MLSFFIWFSGFFTLWDIFWTGTAVLDGDVFGTVFNGLSAVFQFYMFFWFRRKLREQWEREDRIAEERESEWWDELQ